MINFLCGEVVAIEENAIVLKVDNIGYDLSVSGNTLAHLRIGDMVQLHCHMQIREDGITLFGFFTIEEKDLFRQLITVSGVGPKMASTILSGMNTNDLAMAIVDGDWQRLSSIKGLGKKSAERIILELREKLHITRLVDKPQIYTQDEKLAQEVTDILRSLGINKAQATRRIEAAIEAGMTTTEQILNFALRNV